MISTPLPGPAGPSRSPRTVRQHEEPAPWSPVELCRRLRTAGEVSVLLDGGGGAGAGWSVGPLVAIEPRLSWLRRPGDPESPADRLHEVGREVAARRRRGGTAETGILLLVAYEGLMPDGDARSGNLGLPGIAALTVDRSARFVEQQRVRLTVRASGRASAGELLDRTRRQLNGLAALRGEREAARATGSPRTSLPREDYLRAVDSVRRRIARGDVYQANLCQRFEVRAHGDPFELWAGLAGRQAPPRSAYVEWDGVALVSLSPEVFLRATPGGLVETFPIKGTRPRSADPVADRQAARSLLESPKDRAELLMIVDLERNDLGRVCRTGSIAVPQLRELRSFATVHHLVARVTGQLLPEATLPELIAATFPGGSITGAPKRRAMEILRELEPVPRHYFTGSLCWFGDDGSLDSSILIRTLVLAGDRALLGAGGGIVTDSDPEDEWCESNHKARAVTEALGFAPEDAR